MWSLSQQLKMVTYDKDENYLPDLPNDLSSEHKQFSNKKYSDQMDLLIKYTITLYCGLNHHQIRDNTHRVNKITRTALGRELRCIVMRAKVVFCTKELNLLMELLSMITSCFCNKVYYSEKFSACSEQYTINSNVFIAEEVRHP